MIPTFLNKKDCIVFASERQVRRVEEERFALLKCDKIERGIFMLKQFASDEQMQTQPYAKVRSLRAFYRKFSLKQRKKRSYPMIQGFMGSTSSYFNLIEEAVKQNFKS